MSLRHAVIAFALLMCAHSAQAHGIAGNRFFVGTLTFDDPSVADEAIVPNFSTLNGPVEGGKATDNRFDWSFTRLLTPFLQAQVDSGWIHRNWPTARTSGFDTTDVGIKSEIYRNNQHDEAKVVSVWSSQPADEFQQSVRCSRSIRLLPRSSFPASPHRALIQHFLDFAKDRPAPSRQRRPRARPQRLAGDLRQSSSRD
jgi:hypothetical protein